MKIYEEFIKASVEAFRKLKELEVPKEDARFILPQSIGTKLVITANARSLMHFSGREPQPRHSGRSGASGIDAERMQESSADDFQRRHRSLRESEHLAYFTDPMGDEFKKAMEKVFEEIEKERKRIFEIPRKKKTATPIQRRNLR